jgi:hypothetical protein
MGRNLTLYLWAPKIALGSAPAAGAVFRALAENLVTTEESLFWARVVPKQADTVSSCTRKYVLGDIFSDR